MKDTRAKILRVAARFFSQKGFSGTSIRDIVAAAGENVSAINYHFGSKQKLYQATLEYLLDSFRQSLWGKDHTFLTADAIETLSYEQALNRLHQVLDRLVEQGLHGEFLPLERIFTHVELESAPMRKMLLSYMIPFQERPLKLMEKLTGLKRTSPELVFVTHAIFSQVAFNGCHRIAIEQILGPLSKQSLQQRIKKTVWKNTLAILNSYQKEEKR